MSEKKKQVISVWCPNCGIPRNARISLKTHLKRKKKALFTCHACGLVVEIRIPSKSKKVEKEEGSALPSFKDIQKAQKIIRMVGGGR
jgi:transcription elongation factor Elf1